MNVRLVNITDYNKPYQSKKDGLYYPDRRLVVYCKDYDGTTGEIKEYPVSIDPHFRNSSADYSRLNKNAENLILGSKEEFEKKYRKQEKK